MAERTPNPALNPPCQARSRETLERILAVTETLLEEQTFDSISVQDIVRGAKTSVGAFYTRFRQKEALLPLLYGRYDAWLARRVATLERKREWEGRPLEEVVAWTVHQIVLLLSRRRNLMRALALYVRETPAGVDPGTIERRRDQRRFLTGALLSCRDEIHHPEPERAAELALYFVASVVRERVLFAEATHSASVGVSSRELEQEVTRMALGYLGAGKPRRKKR